MNLFLGKYKATVFDVIEGDDVGAGFAKIRVICPKVYGIDYEGNYVVSPPCQACVPSPHDYHVPEPGQKVWIEFEEGDPEFPIWVGSYPSIDQQRVDEPKKAGDNPLLIEKKKEGRPKSVVNDEEVHDRVIGSRFGSYLKFDDTNELLILQVFGPTADKPDQAGPIIILDNKNKQVQLMSPSGNLINVTKDSIYMTASDGSKGGYIGLKPNKLDIIAGSVVMTCEDTFHLRSAKLLLGTGTGGEPAVLGNKLLQQLSDMLNPLNTLAQQFLVPLIGPASYSPSVALAASTVIAQISAMQLLLTPLTSTLVSKQVTVS
jgi:hypothetical protein